jgi:hypothetical protein
MEIKELIVELQKIADQAKKTGIRYRAPRQNG